MSTQGTRTRILFVDDDLATLQRLEHDLRTETATWDMRFVSNSHAALAELEYRDTADVIVADLHMKPMDGATLMSLIRAKHPKTVRILTSKNADSSYALQAVPVAHRLLKSPVKPTELVVAIESTLSLQQMIASAPLLSSIGGIDLLPSPPASVLELNMLLSRQDTSIEEIAALIAQDSAMTAKLLQLVNSSMFGLNHRITSAQHAVSLLGLATVRNLLTAVELVRSFATTEPDLVKAIEQLHNHSLAVAEQARNLMKQHPLVHDALAAGMMHDVGLLAIIATQPERYRELCAAVGSGKTLAECEIEIIGASHAHIGAYLLGLWGLPYSLVEAVARSHDADNSTDLAMNPVHAVFLGEQIVNMRNDENSSWESARLPSQDYMHALGVEHLVAQSVSRPSHTLV